MNRSLALPLFLASLFPATSLAQDDPTPAPQTHKAHTVAALVSADARTLVDSRQGQWTVANPVALAGFANQHVRVKYVLATAPQTIQILSVKPALQQTLNTAYKSDSAFRR